MRILIFGPNGSGKGTQASRLAKRFSLAHIESGGIFRDQIGRGTDLGKKAKAFMDKGELVPDSITIPMILNRLGQDECRSGWILDGFPRTPSQSRSLIKGLENAGLPLDAVIVIEVAVATAKGRLLGRRNCPNGHANNTAIAAIRPKQEGDRPLCWRCGAEVGARKDDLDEGAIDQRLDIYFAQTLAAIREVDQWAKGRTGVRIIRVDGEGTIESIQEYLLSKLD